MSGPLGVDPGRSILYAQVTDSDPRMAFDEEGFMHRIGTKGSFGKAYLGDVTRVALRSMGSHGPPKFTKLPRIDEQNWEMDCSTDSLRVKIASKHYWGFGLFSKCFLNKITIEGELPTRARYAMDIAASLGRNPWEPARVRAFERATSASMEAHTSSWEGLISIARESFSEDIASLQDSIHRMKGVSESSDHMLEEAEGALERAREALADKNAPAVERALSRASSAIVRADSDHETSSMERILLED